MDRDKKQLRKLKRDVKRAGQKKQRQKLKRDLDDHPEDAHLDNVEFGDLSSATLNGLDEDATRRRAGAPQK